MVINVMKKNHTRKGANCHFNRIAKKSFTKSNGI